METVKALLDMGANVDECDERGSTALMTAAQWGHVEVCRLLLERGADVNKSDKQGDTALHEAARADEMDAVEVLGEWEGVDVDAKNKHGCTALHVASHAGLGAMVKLLVRLGSCVHGQMKGGYTSLHVVHVVTRRYTSLHVVARRYTSSHVVARRWGVYLYYHHFHHSQCLPMLSPG